MRICSHDTLDTELGVIRKILSENGYPDKFIERNWSVEPKTERVHQAEKKTLFLRIPYKGDAAAERITKVLSASVKATFNAAKLRCLFTTSPLIVCQNKDKLPLLTSSMIIYQFKCICGATHLGRT